MKSIKILTFSVVLSLGCFGTALAQYGYGGYGGGYGGYGYGGYGYGRSAIPQADVQPKEEAPKTPEEIVDSEMPNIAEAIDLNEFESAVVGSILLKYMKKRQQLFLLKLDEEKTKEGMEAILKGQEQELRAGLPPEKYDAFVKLQTEGVKKVKRQKKKKNKNN